MASTDDNKTAAESSAYAAPSAAGPPLNYFRVDFFLRLLVFASTFSALVVLLMSKETKTIPTSLPPPFAFISRDAKFNYSPALIYLLVALCVACLYSIITILPSFIAISSPSPSTKTLFLLVAFDALMAGIMASATGSSAAVAYVGLKGNSHVGWAKVCNLYGKFCRYVGSSVSVSLFASIVLVLLVVVSSYSLYRRSH